MKKQWNRKGPGSVWRELIKTRERLVELFEYVSSEKRIEGEDPYLVEHQKASHNLVDLFKFLGIDGNEINCTDCFDNEEVHCECHGDCRCLDPEG